MQMVILAGGRGTRMKELTESTPKPLLQIEGKTLIEYKLDNLPDCIDSVVIVVGYLKEQFYELLGDSYKGKSITYVTQPTFSGTGGALLCAREALTGEFMVMMGDDLYATEDIQECASHAWAVNVKTRHHVEMGGEVLMDETGAFSGIREGKHFVEEGLINTGLYKLQMEYFDYPSVVVPDTQEYGLPHTLALCAADTRVEVVLTERSWKQISAPEDLVL